MDSMMQRILRMEWSIPADVEVSPECRDLLCKLLVGDPRHRLTMAQIQVGGWACVGGGWMAAWHGMAAAAVFRAGDAGAGSKGKGLGACMGAGR